MAFTAFSAPPRKVVPTIVKSEPVVATPPKCIPELESAFADRQDILQRLQPLVVSGKLQRYCNVKETKLIRNRRTINYRPLELCPFLEADRRHSTAANSLAAAREQETQTRRHGRKRLCRLDRPQQKSFIHRRRCLLLRPPTKEATAGMARCTLRWHKSCQSSRRT